MKNNDKGLEILKNGIAKVAGSEQFKTFLNMKKQFHNYSLHNLLMIHAQRPGATHVAGFKAWKKHGRWVKKGEKGIAIWAPRFIREKDAFGKVEKKLIGFRLVYVFDASQTDGQELPKPPKCEMLKGDDGGVYDKLVALAEKQGAKVSVEMPGNPDAYGDCNLLTGLIRIKPELDGYQKAKTLAHELAHWMLHQPEKTKGLRLNTGAIETEAESVAFLVLDGLGMPVDEFSFSYIAGWAQGDLTVLEKSLGRIDKASKAILEGLA